MSQADIKGQKARGETRMQAVLKTASWLAAIGASALCCQQVAAQSKDAEPATQAANTAFIAGLPFASQTDFEDADAASSPPCRTA